MKISKTYIVTSFKGRTEIKYKDRTYEVGNNYFDKLTFGKLKQKLKRKWR